jgi:parvulin-like peptidyl-prolyl isomerase
LSTLAKALLVVVIILAVGAGLVFWQTKLIGHTEPDFSIAKSEMELFIADFNPMQLNTLAEKPDEKARLVKNLKETLAIASAAEKAGIGNDPIVKSELESMEAAILAFNFDKEINKDKGPMPPFGWVSEDQIKAFWGEKEEDPQASWFTKQFNKISWIWEGRNARWHESEFSKFLDTKISLARKRGQIQAGQEPSEQDLAAARDSFARSKITYYDAMAKLKTVPAMTDPAEKKKWEDFETKVAVQTKLQKAQLLSQTYLQDVMAKDIVVNDVEVEAYINEHPELTKTAEKRKTANEVLEKVKKGGDFAELAKEYSDDPGSKSRGGLYEGVVKGQFAPEFEKAVDSLKVGEVAPEIVETEFGFHIIKLEKTGQAKGSNGIAQPTFDARHILISTMFKDPSDPTAREMPVKRFVKTKLEKDKQKAALEKILKENPVSIPEDFVIPKPSEADTQKMREQQMQQMQRMQQQQQMQQRPGATGRPVPAPPKAGPPAPPAK